MPAFQRDYNQEYSSQDHRAYLVNHFERTQADDLASYTTRSGVSSFDLPLHYDSTFVSPVSMTSSAALTTKSVPSMKREPYVKSAGSLSPTYGLYSPDSDFEQRYNPPMKHKDPVLHISTEDNFFPPGSLFACSSPDFGRYSVSASAHSSKTSQSSPNFNHSPDLQSGAGYSSNGYYSRNQTPVLSTNSYTCSSQTPAHVDPSPSNAPVLLAPNPGNPSISKPAAMNFDSGAPLQRSTPPKKTSKPCRKKQKSTQKNHSRVGHHKASSKEQKSGKTKVKIPKAVYEKIVSSVEYCQMPAEGRMLLQLVANNDLPWKVIGKEYNAIFSKFKRDGALQMQKMRLVESFQVWTDVETRALELSVHANQANHGKKKKWKAVSRQMTKYGAKEKWSAEGCQKKWVEMQGKESLSQYEMARMAGYRRHGTSSSDLTPLSLDQQSWPEKVHSVSHSPFADGPSQSVSALSTATLDDDTRSGTARDANAQMHIPQHHLQHIQPQQTLYGQQNQPSHAAPQHQERQYSQAQAQYYQFQTPRTDG